MDYRWRSDGMFLIKCVCASCGDEWDVCALAQYQELCPACRQVQEWERKLNDRERSKP